MELGWTKKNKHTNLRRGNLPGTSDLCTYKKQKERDIGALHHKTACRLLQNDIAYLADRCGSPTIRTNPGYKMTKRTPTKEQYFFLFS